MKLTYELKFLAIVFLITAFVVNNVDAQGGLSVNATSTPADPSAMLDVSSTDKGVLIPRITEAQKLAIQYPATGLMIYQTDATTGFWYYNGSSWVQFGGSQGPAGATGATGFLLPGTNAGNTPFWDGSQWVVNSSNIFNNGGNVGIGTSNPDNSALLHLNSTAKGALMPRMTTSQRNAIQNPAQGLMIYNITNKCFEFYEIGLWQPMACTCTPPATPTAASTTPASTQIVWKWNKVFGAAGYKYNTVNDSANAINVGTDTSFTQSGLACQTTYNLYVWTYSNCGNSNALVLTQTTGVCGTWACGDDMTVTHTAGSIAPVSKTVSYGTVSANLTGADKCWITKNLGADVQPSSVTDNSEAASGWFWQFNRIQGYKHDGVNRTPNTTWINPIDENLDWEASKDPCFLLLGTSWRMPTKTEWTNADANGAWATFNDNYNSVLKLHAAGILNYDNGDKVLAGTYGRYGSSTQTYSAAGNVLHFTNSTSEIQSYVSKSYAHTLRCLKD